MDRRDPDWIIMGTWLVENLGTCTCGGGDYGHERHCGLEPIVDLATLSGWKEADEARQG
jgi:hypothetical protein